MRCKNPTFLEAWKMYVPCGKCMQCRVARVAEWTVRIQNEKESFGRSTFITLTYDDDHIPTDQSLKKHEIQVMMKRLRRLLDDRKIRYYISGEYGEKNFRPHYHGILFDVDQKDFKLLERRFKKGKIYFLYDFPPWSDEEGKQKGDVCFGDVVPQTIRYTAQYIIDKMMRFDGTNPYYPREAPFQLFSKGFGREYLVEYKEKLIENKSVIYHGTSMGLPRYYKRKLGIDSEELLKMRLESDVYKKQLEHLEKCFIEKGRSDHEIMVEMQRIRDQKENNLIARIKLIKGERL